MNNALQLDEVFDELTQKPTREERRAYFTEVVKSNPSVVGYLRMAFVPEYKITGLPEGYPPGPNGRVLIDKDIPAGMGFTTLRLELRRFQTFAVGGSTKVLTEERRAYMWARQIEGLHWREAELITAIKDGTLLTLYPVLLDVVDLAGITLADPRAPKA